MTATPGVEMQDDPKQILSQAWNEYDEAEWQSLLACEPYAKNYTPKEKNMIELTPQANRGASVNAKGVQFLSPKHVPENGKLVLECTEVTTNEPDTYGNPIVIYFKDASGTQYSKGFKTSSDNLRDICNIWTRDEKTWKGKKTTVTVIEGRRGGTQMKFAK
jgi:hypothetical protein